MDRRELIKGVGLTTATGALGLWNVPAQSKEMDQSEIMKGLPSVKIKKVKAIATSPHGIELIVVKVETDQPGLVGYGCATFRQRAHAVVAAIDNYLDDFCNGKSVENIEDIWQTAYVSSYWRNGPVLNNALSGLDQALWDIKGKIAGMPVYQLLGGLARTSVRCYGHASGLSNWFKSGAENPRSH